MAQPATSPPPMHDPTSLPPSPSDILAPWTAPDIPKTIKDSFSAWMRHSDGGANAELHLYRRCGYFDGAALNNVANAELHTAFAEASSQRASNNVDLPPSSLSEPSARATVGTKLHSDGKVGSIRLIDIGSPCSSSWFSTPTRRQMNMLEIGKPSATPDSSEEKVVLLHGYGAGTAFFFQNLAGMARHANSRLYALDWLGMGRSSRVPFHISNQDAKTTESRVGAAESFFIQALEDWRQKMGVERMTLVGHSLGAYLSIAYSLKYPDRVSRLVLVSPAGVPEGPREGDLFSPKKNGKSVEAEVQEPQEEHVPASDSQARKDAQEMKKIDSRDTQVNQTEKNSGAPPRLGSKTRTVLTWLWERNTSPFGLIRSSLFFGPLLVGRYTSRRFGTLPDDELRSLHAYCQAVFSSRGSSEYCLAHLLAPGAYARLPMVSRLSVLPSTLPVSFVYGKQDWMDVQGGLESVRRLNTAGNRLGSVFVVPNAGHHVYLDNPTAFDTLLARILNGKADGIANVE